MSVRRALIVVRGGGDLATGVAARLHRCGAGVLVPEIDKPLAVRRLVALAEAVYSGEITIEELRGRRVEEVTEAWRAIEAGDVPVMVDPKGTCMPAISPLGLIDARMRKTPNELGIKAAPFVVGLGPGFIAAVDCHAVVETQRGHHLGRVYWAGGAAPDTGVPEPVAGRGPERVLRAPRAGVLRGVRPLGDIVEAGEPVAAVDGVEIRAPFRGAVRGLLHDGLQVVAGAKVGDLDPRAEPTYCSEISDKALAVGGGVLEALLSNPDIRRQLGA
ncbi:MAG: selenium-dependent molybdenum cofactor biosynthesis protein YqeB [Actinobacteria bacterium]|nr:selenium-dependent molybdenum cofactor biosynthesis protein YqeB [Actinomycetota bacterium]